MKNIKSTEISEVIQKKCWEKREIDEKIAKIEKEKDQTIKKKQELISILQQQLANKEKIDDFNAKNIIHLNIKILFLIKII